MNAIPTTVKNVLHVMDETGDTTHEWNPGNPAEVEAARSTFDTLKGKGYLAYSVTGSGNKGKALSAFDATLGKIILSPPMAGG